MSKASNKIKELLKIKNCSNCKCRIQTEDTHCIQCQYNEYYKKSTAQFYTDLNLTIEKELLSLAEKVEGTPSSKFIKGKK